LNIALAYDPYQPLPELPVGEWRIRLGVYGKPAVTLVRFCLNQWLELLSDEGLMAGLAQPMAGNPVTYLALNLKEVHISDWMINLDHKFYSLNAKD
jgi:hypothetical protein